MLGRLFFYLLHCVSDASDAVARWLRRRWRHRADDERITVDPGMARWGARWQYRFFAALRWCSQLLDLPVQAFRRWRLQRIQPEEQVSLLSTLEGWVTRAFWIFFWILRFPLDQYELFVSKRKASLPTKGVDPNLAERQLQAELQRKSAEAARQQALAKSWTGRLGRWAIAPVAGLWAFWRVYWRTRSVALLGWGIPVTAVVGLLLSVYFHNYWYDYGRLAPRYEVALLEAVKAGDTTRANQYRLKLEQLGVRTDRGQYRAAVALAEEGDWAGAYAKMCEIVDPQRPGFPSAHAWMVQHLLDGRLPVPVDQATKLALQHLQQLRTRVGVSDDLLFWEAMAHYRQQNLPQARVALTEIKRSFPAASALLMQVCWQLQQADAARTAAVAVQRQLQQKVAEGIELTTAELQWQVAATELIGDAAQAAAAVEQWYAANPDSSEARLRRATLLLRSVDAWLQQPSAAGQADALKSLRLAAETIPSEDVAVVQQRLTTLGTGGSRPELHETLYQAVLALPELPSWVLAHVGSLQASRQEWASADELLARATVAEPNLAVAWNNRAFVLNSAFVSRRFEALEYADRAVGLDADRTDFRQTRGLIYFNLRRWDQAIEDLEIASNGVKDLGLIHAALAESYRQIGNPMLAEVYQSQVE